MGFLDSASSLRDTMDATMAAALNETMPIRADEARGAECGAHTEARANGRNGYGRRGLEAVVGATGLGAPKLRSGPPHFPTGLFGRWSRTDRALAAAVAETCVTGTSTRRVERVAAKSGVGPPPKDQVSRPCAVVGGGVDAPLSRGWPAARLACLLLDAAYVRRRAGGRALGGALLTAIGVGDDGRRHLLGLACANAEGHASWRGFPQGPEERVSVNIISTDSATLRPPDPPTHLHRFRLLTGPLLDPHAGGPRVLEAAGPARYPDDGAVVAQPVGHRRRRRAVAWHLAPPACADAGGHYRGPLQAAAPVHKLEQQVGAPLSDVEAAQPVYHRQAAALVEAPPPRQRPPVVVGPQVGDHLGAAREAHLPVRHHALVAEGDRQAGLPDARAADQHHVVAALHELQRGELLDDAARDARPERPVEVGGRLREGEARHARHGG
jgi:hypothetical protein